MSQMRWYKGRPRWWVAVLGLVCAVAAAVLAGSGSSPWVVGVGVVAALGFLGSEGMRFVNTHLDKGDDHLKLLQRTTTGSKWPKVRETTPVDFGSRKSLHKVEYRHRSDVEKTIRTALRRGEPVLVVGSSMAGKSRVAAEVLLHDYPDKRLCRPAPPSGLAELLAHGTPKDSVVFLDDLERHLVSADLHQGWLKRITEPDLRNVVVGTMRRTAMEGLQATGELRHPHARVVQEGFSVVELIDSDAVNAEMARGISDPVVAAGVLKYGIGTYLGGGHRAMGRLMEAADSHPLGVAMVRAASAWRMTGLDSIAVPTLQRLAAEYAVSKPGSPHPESAADALAWATALEEEVVQLLEVVGADQVRCCDYVHDQLAGIPSPTATTYCDPHPRPIPWGAAAEAATTTGETLELSIRAHEAGHSGLAESLLEQVLRSGGPNSGGAAYNLGVLLAERSDFDGARAAYQAGINAHQSDFDLMAAVNLGVIERQLGDSDAARAAYRYAIDAGHEEQTPMALTNLGNLEAELGNSEPARLAYEAAIRSGHPIHSAKASLGLGELERKDRNVAAARAAYVRATEAPDPHIVAEAASRWGDLERDAGDPQAATQAYNLALATGVPKEDAARAGAAFELGMLEKHNGNSELARAMFHVAIESGHADIAPAAAANLGLLEADLGNVEAARAAFQIAIQSEHTQTVIPLVAFSLGLLEAEQGRPDAAREAYQTAMQAGNEEIAAVAAFNLGGIERRLGNTEDARRAYVLAVASTDPAIAQAATEAMDELVE